MSFPNDAITIYLQVTGNTVLQPVIAGNDDKTIIGVSMQQSKDLSDTTLFCGNTVFAKNYAKDLPFNILNFHCSDVVRVSKNGNDSASIILTYVPYLTSDLGTSTQSQSGYNPPTNISSSSDIIVYGSFSAGEILIALFLFILIWIKLVSFIPMALAKIKTKKKYLGYGGGDVEIRDDN